MALIACTPPDELPVVARGRYVELATKRPDRICGGTIHLLDGLVEESFRFLGETPPDRVFVRYEWLPEPDDPSSFDGEGSARGQGDRVLIRTDQLVHEHEIGHVAPTMAWPNTARFLREGLAIQLDGRRSFSQEVWPEGLEIDDVLDGPFDGGTNYWASWFLVSQILRDHGMDGLRALWFQVPADATPAEIRSAYHEVFDEPMEALLAWVPPAVGPGGGGNRVPCLFSLCPGTAHALDGGSFLAPGPSGCEDDPHAIGPYSRLPGLDGPPVWRESIVTPSGVATPEYSSELALKAEPCFLDCRGYGGPGVFRPIDGEWSNVYFLPDGSWRLEVHQELEALPTEDAAGIMVVDDVK